MCGVIFLEQQIQNELDLIKESILNNVSAETIYLFGSYANGTHNEDSDIDIYVVVPDDVGNLIDLQANIRMGMRKKRTKPMDLLIGTTSVFNRRKEGPTLERVIANEGVRLYG